MNFKINYNNTPDQTKLDFLNESIMNDPALQARFIAFINSSEKNNRAVINSNEFDNLVNRAQKKYQSIFEEIDTENPDWDNYHPPHSGYIEEWEAYQLATEQEIQDILNNFKEEAINLVLGQKIAELLALGTGVYFACENADIDDPVDSFDTINDELLIYFKMALNDINEKISLSVVPGNVNSAFEPFLSFYDKNQIVGTSFFEYLEPMMLALSEKTTQPQELLAAFDNSNIKRSDVPKLLLLLNKNSGDDSAWLESAEKYYQTNDDIAKQLIDYYLKNDRQKYLECARKLFETNKSYWAEYLQNSITHELDKQLYVDVFYELCTYHQDIKYYKKISAFLSDIQKERLLTEMSTYARFAVEILTVEKRYTEIKDVVTSNMHSYDFVQLVSPIIEIYPEFCFNAIKQQVTKTIASERGRHVYERIVEKMQLAKKIPGFTDQTNELINQLYNHKPNLPALKSEFRIGGLV
ncbi:hypothetical protein L21SP5_03440 [Salinivirga cyanobacteriivorans]|uniref:Uncharacterized protein n=1 Tax=Salinivirga cyanobacteriivorans TaxID=1307839 RepID=A0A0S2I4C8_9BACT|nr:hypothetical protein [Salinivirga cyanobacteriivorans]ALO17051.1 hypothetical protein L21SP5_03440 [Salinivirga cyanobacteriivorans]